MRKPELKRMTAALRQLTPAQRRLVATELAALDTQPAAISVIEARFAAGANCPHCQAKHVPLPGMPPHLYRIEWHAAESSPQA
jgi:hypothetical protein